MADEANRHEQEESKSEQPVSSVLKGRVPHAEGEDAYRFFCDFSDLKAFPENALTKFVDTGFQLVPVDRHAETVILSDEHGGPPNDLQELCDSLGNPSRTIGITTGHGSGVVVLRFKGQQGLRSLRAMQAGREPLATLEAGNSGKGYKFLIFTAPKESLPSREQIAPGVDFLGEGGHFVPEHSSWSPQPTEVVPMPDWLLDLVKGATTFGYTEMVAAGDFSSLNNATPFEAAQAYRVLGWKICPVNEEGQNCCEAGKYKLPVYWESHQELGIAVETGINFGIVGLWFGNENIVASWEKRHGQLPQPQLICDNPSHLPVIIHCFRAPAEKFPSMVLENGVEYIGEGDGLFLPPSTIKGGAYRWRDEKEFLPGLLEIPQGLRSILSAPQSAGAKSQAQSPTQSVQGGGSGHLPQLGIAAQELAARGWLVFPLKPGGKTPRTKNGHKNATRDPAMIATWWRKWKNANIGVQTGVESGLVVLDVDVKNGQPGLQTLARLEEQHGRLETLRARTPSGGLHLFFRAPVQEVRNRTGVLPGLDIRGQGGYVVVAPSRIGGESYRWENPSVQPAEMPAYLVDLATSRPRKTGGGTSSTPQERLTYADAFAGVQEGSRNDMIFRFASKLRLEGCEYNEAAVFVRMAANACHPPFTEDEALLCLESAWSYAPPEALTDLGNAERFVARCGANVRYVQEKDRWLVWAGHWWHENKRALFRMATATIRSIRDEAVATSDPDRKRLLFSHSRRSESEEGIVRMLSLAGPELSVRVEDLDQGELVAFANGVFDPVTGSLRPGRRSDMLSKRAPFPYDPARTDYQPRISSQTAARQNRSSAPTGPSWEERFDSWTAERCELGENFFAWAKELREDFSNWSGEDVSSRRFGELVRSKGFVAQKSNDYKYLGLRLRV